MVAFITPALLLHLTLYVSARPERYWKHDSDWKPSWTEDNSEETPRWKKKLCRHSGSFAAAALGCNSEDSDRQESTFSRSLEQQLKDVKAENQRVEKEAHRLKEQLEKEKTDKQQAEQQAELDKKENTREEKIRRLAQEDRMEERRLQRERKQEEATKRSERHAQKHGATTKKLERDLEKEKNKVLQFESLSARHAQKHDATTKKLERDLEQEKKKVLQFEKELQKSQDKLRNTAEAHKAFVQHLEKKIDTMHEKDEKLRNEKENHKTLVRSLEVQQRQAERIAKQHKARVTDLQDQLNAKDVELRRIQSTREKSSCEPLLRNISAMAAEHHRLSEELRKEKQKTLLQSSATKPTFADESSSPTYVEALLQSSAEHTPTNAPSSLLQQGALAIALIVGTAWLTTLLQHPSNEEEVDELKNQLRISNEARTSYEVEIKSELGGMMKIDDASASLNGEFSYHIFDQFHDHGKVRSIKIQCPGVVHSDIHIDIISNGCEVIIDRKPARGVTAIKWTHKFQFRPSEGQFEFKEDQAGLESGILMLVFRAYAFKSRVFRFPKHFDLANQDVGSPWNLPDDNSGIRVELTSVCLKTRKKGESSAPGRLEATVAAAEFAQEVQISERAETSASPIDTEDYNAIGEAIAIDVAHRCPFPSSTCPEENLEPIDELIAKPMLSKLVHTEEPTRASPPEEHASGTEVLSSSGASDDYEKIGVTSSANRDESS